MRTIGRVRAEGGGRDLDATRTGDAGRSPRGNETRHATRRMICDVDAMIVETDGKTGARRRWPRIRGPPRDPRRPCVRNARRSHHGSCRPRSLFYHIATTQLPCTWYGSHSPYPRRELYENTRVPLYQQVGDSRVRDEKGRHLLEGTINARDDCPTDRVGQTCGCVVVDGTGGTLLPRGSQDARASFAEGHG